MTDVPELVTPRLLLRGWQPADREPFAGLNADPRVMEHFVTPLTRGQSDAFVDRIERSWRDHGYGLWAVQRRDDATFIGYVGLWTAAFEAAFTPAVEVGWRLAADHWGHGFATEAAREALRYGFDVVGLDEIVTFTAVANARSRRVMEGLGMPRDAAGDFDHPVVPAGHPLRPHVLHRLRREAWRSAPTATHDPRPTTGADPATDPDTHVAVLRRWEDSGARWRVLSRAHGRLAIALLTCDGGEEVERLDSNDPELFAFVGDRDGSDP